MGKEPSGGSSYDPKTGTTTAAANGNATHTVADKEEKVVSVNSGQNGRGDGFPPLVTPPNPKFPRNTFGYDGTIRTPKEPRTPQGNQAGNGAGAGNGNREDKVVSVNSGQNGRPQSASITKLSGILSYCQQAKAACGKGGFAPGKCTGVASQPKLARYLWRKRHKRLRGLGGPPAGQPRRLRKPRRGHDVVIESIAHLSRQAAVTNALQLARPPRTLRNRRTRPL